MTSGDEPTADGRDGREEPGEPRSRSAARREAVAVTDLAVRLTRLRPFELARIALEPELREAVELCPALRRGALVRQKRRIAKLLRESDVAAIASELERASGSADGAGLAERRDLAWRSRLLEEGDSALQEFVVAYPAADRAQLRQLIRNAGRAPESPSAKRAPRDLLRAITSARRANEADSRDALDSD